MNLTKKQQRWIKELEELWNLFDKHLREYTLKSNDHRLQILLALMGASHGLIRGFLAQLRGGSNDNLQSKLRTLTEAFFNARYILLDDNDFKARAFILDSKIVRIKRLNDIIRLMEQNKAPSMAAVGTIESYKELKESLQQEVSKEETSLGEQNAKWPPVDQRAKKAGLEEYYSTVFYLFSQDNHMSADSLNGFLRRINGGLVVNTELDLSDLDQEIQTAYAYYLLFIHLCSEKFGFLAEDELKKFNSSEMLTAVPSSTQ